MEIIRYKECLYDYLSDEARDIIKRVTNPLINKITLFEKLGSKMIKIDMNDPIPSKFLVTEYMVVVDLKNFTICCTILNGEPRNIFYSFDKADLIESVLSSNYGIRNEHDSGNDSLPFIFDKGSKEILYDTVKDKIENLMTKLPELCGQCDDLITQATHIINSFSEHSRPDYRVWLECKDWLRKAGVTIKDTE